MKNHSLFLLHSFLFIILLIFSQFPFIFSDNQTEWYDNCRNLFSCGVINGAGYPFWGGKRSRGCGHPGFELACENDIPVIDIMAVRYRVLEINPDSQILRIIRQDFGATDLCPDSFMNTTLDYNIFEYSSGYENVTVQYGCPLLYIQIPSMLTCTVNGTTYQNGYVVPGAQGPGLCRESVFFPIRSTTIGIMQELPNLGPLIDSGFEVKWKLDGTGCNQCKNSSGSCGYDLKSGQFTCSCPSGQFPISGDCSRHVSSDGQYRNASVSTPYSGNQGLSSNASIGLAIGGAVLAGIGVGWLIFWYRQRRKRIAAGANASQELPPESKDISAVTDSKSLLANSVPSVAFSKSIPSYHSSKSEFGKDTTSYFGVQVFTYSELEEATDNFARSRELGDGGFGAVYYGVLNDGRIVAVKRLYENNFKRVEQFMNEVEILTRLRHQNLVQLFGCTSKRSSELLLVYEYIPNGTVADHLHGKRSKSGLMSWPVRLNIAIETAEALAYLHESDIIHRDVKTNNILLDNDFHVKVADFGLSRLFPNDVTHVSTAPQGTPGYVDPEYYQCYQLTEKSDIYSFGVVLIEIISSLQAVDTNRHRHDINLANMAVNKIQNHQLHELVDPTLEFGTNSSVRRMMTLVAELAFRCLQHERDMRPSMKEVLNALKAIQNEGLNAEKAEVLDILIDDSGHSEDKTSSASPTSVVPDTWVSSSGPNSSG